jgi:hypothetical protein
VLVARRIYQNGCFYVATSCGVPVKSSNSIDGWDSVLSILNPVAVTVALNGAKMEFLHKSLEVDQCVLDKIIFYEGLKQAVDKASELKNNYLY